MTSLDFLYIALGGGFMILVIFLCVLILYVVLILRDVNKITENFKESSDRIREVVIEPMKALSEMSVGFGLVHDLIEKIRSKQAEAMEDDLEDMEVEDEVQEEQAKTKSKSDKKGKGGFSINKLRK
jgi:ABC-type transport system involved in cytochrome bd biosynthesis fused ATPase/permease subunit